MAIKTEQETIDGFEIMVTQFPVMEAIKIQVYLGKNVLPAVGNVIGGLKSLSLDSEIDLDGDSLSAAFEKLFANLSEKEAEDLVLRLLKTTRINGVEATADVLTAELSGSLLTVYKIIWFVLKVNYPDFFGLGASIGALIQKTGSLVQPGNEEND